MFYYAVVFSFFDYERGKRIKLNVDVRIGAEGNKERKI